jgi:transposase
MAYRCGDRHQMTLLPQSIEEYVAESDPVRAYDAFVEALDFDKMGIDINPYKVGNSEYDPRSMLKLLVYGYSYGVKSSRKLERECYHNISFIWLMGGLKPDHKTIAEFRRRNKKALKNVLRHCARVCIKLKLIAGNILFVDGTKIRANAARHRTHDRGHYERFLADIDRRIDDLLEECESTDRQESGAASYVTMDKELSRAQDLKSRIKGVLDTFKADERRKVNQTDPDCAVMNSVQGSHAGYNVQSVVDDGHGLIVHVEAVTDATDINQFARQIEQANELFEKPCDIAVADAGYACTDELAKIDEQSIKVIVPSKRQALHEEEGPFSKSHFTYNREQDCYFCPEGHRLGYEWMDKKTGMRYYRITSEKRCPRCLHFGQCTTSRKGRRIARLHNEDIKQKLEEQYQEAASQGIYARRKTRVEHPFGHIKRNLKTDAFLLRGTDGVQAETSLLATCFNVARMITIFGVSVLQDKLATLRMEPVAA